MSGNALRSLGFGAALAVLTALSCLAFAAARDPQTWSLQQLSAADTVPMTCAQTSPATSEPLWCADPSSPQCLPAVPDAPRLELWDQLELSLRQEQDEPALAYVLLPWSRPHFALPRGFEQTGRLERPPRT